MENANLIPEIKVVGGGRREGARRGYMGSSSEGNLGEQSEEERQTCEQNKKHQKSNSNLRSRYPYIYHRLTISITAEGPSKRHDQSQAKSQSSSSKSMHSISSLSGGGRPSSFSPAAVFSFPSFPSVSSIPSVSSFSSSPSLS